jgi:hypothetical protein
LSWKQNHTHKEDNGYGYYDDGESFAPTEELTIKRSFIHLKRKAVAELYTKSTNLVTMMCK